MVLNALFWLVLLTHAHTRARTHTGQSNMAVTLDDFGNYTSDPDVNVSKIYDAAASYSHQIRFFTILVSGKPPLKSAAPYQWGIPSRDTLGGGGASPATGNVAPPRSVNYTSIPLS